MDNKFNKFLDLINNIKNGKEELVYCSLAEINDVKPLLMVKFTSIRSKVILESDESALFDMYNLILDSKMVTKGYISSEFWYMTAVYFLMFGEVYIFSKMLDVLNDYYKKGDYSHVPTLDKPYAKKGEEQITARYKEMVVSYQTYLDGDKNELYKFFALTYNFSSADKAI